MKSLLRLTVTLLLICALMAGILAGVNAITKDRIAEAREAKLQAAISQVLPSADAVTEVALSGDTGIVSRVYRAGDAYAVEVNPVGFGGAITMMVGIEQDTVTGICIVSQTETAGLGAVAAATNSKGEAFRAQFRDWDGSLDAISGATVTSKAVALGVQTALDFVKEGL